MQKSWLAEICQAELKGRTFDLAVLPIASCEVHGMHLPFGTDAFQASELARRAAERATARGANVLVLPTIPFGCDQNLMEFPYTVTLQPTTILRILDDLVGSLAAHGLKKFLILNGHGGNVGTLDAAARELYGKHGAFLARIEWWLVADDVIREINGTGEVEHAGQIETSVALALFPQFVKMESAERATTRATRLQLFHKHGGKFLRPWRLFTPNGGVGDPTKATREKGEKVVAATVERLADVLVELAAAKLDGTFPY